MSEQYGTKDSWDLEQYEKAEKIWEQYKDHDLKTIDDLADIVGDLMISHGPDGHCDGNQIIALIAWRLLKKEK